MEDEERGEIFTTRGEREMMMMMERKERERRSEEGDVIDNGNEKCKWRVGR